MLAENSYSICQTILVYCIISLKKGLSANSIRHVRFLLFFGGNDLKQSRRLFEHYKDGGSYYGNNPSYSLKNGDGLFFVIFEDFIAQTY